MGKESQKIFNSNVEKELKFREISPEEFIAQRDKLPLSLRAFLTPHKKGDYVEMETALYLSEDNKCGFGLNPDGALISVFSLEKEMGPFLVQKALSCGAKYLSCLGEKLKELYEEANFIVTKEDDWNQDYAPEHWDYERFGTPNYYEMELKKLEK